ncbi:MAG: NAD(P)-dependent glycerol-1-phosphate dehydrogenase [Methanosarcinales archaeon Met12]|nr:MAG: NAD(P)-dependent glycerol-1-phosphate dehydrogenase [Methanosarcinales archaeon Met12]
MEAHPAQTRANRWMQLPRNIIIGQNAIHEIVNVCNDLKLQGCAMVITGLNTKKIAGDVVVELLSDGGYCDTDLIEVLSASMHEVERVKGRANDIGAAFLLGVGGGKCIDIAKLASTQLNIPFLSVPTTASHDGIASSRASLMQSGQSISMPAQAPMGIVVDTKVIASAPYRLLASGCGDIISNYTAVMDWQLAKRLGKLHGADYSEYAAALSKMTAQILIDASSSIKPGSEKFVRIVVKALISSGVAMSIAGSSRPASGSEHKFSHALDRLSPKPALHGEQCGVGTIMMMYLHGGDWQSIRDSLRNIGAPTNSKELGIEDKYIIEALVHAHEIRPERYTILGDGLSREDAEELAKTTKVI